MLVTRSFTGARRALPKPKVLHCFQYTHSQLTRRHNHNAVWTSFEKDFGSLVFSPAVMESKMPSEIVKQYKEYLKKKQPFPIEVADAVAHSMKEWAIEKGATHFTHW